MSALENDDIQMTNVAFSKLACSCEHCNLKVSVPFCVIYRELFSLIESQMKIRVSYYSNDVYSTFC